MKKVWPKDQWDRVQRAIAAGWTHCYVASGPSAHPMAQGIRSIESGPPEGDEELIGTPPGMWMDKGNGTGSGPSERLPE